MSGLSLTIFSIAIIRNFSIHLPNCTASQLRGQEFPHDNIPCFCVKIIKIATYFTGNYPYVQNTVIYFSLICIRVDENGG